MSFYKSVAPFYLILAILAGCNSTINENNTDVLSPTKPIEPKNRALTNEFKEYWFAGEAEITSFELLQERYGELREGTAVTIFVTEEFLDDAQVKADEHLESNIPVLKLNKTKKFVTGIYPYSIMTSVFNEINYDSRALKITNSVQEWCGQVFMQLNNRRDFEIQAYSYFASEGDAEIKLDPTYLEDEFWNLIRLNPEELPTGDLSVIPAFEYLRLRHKEPKAYEAYASLMQGDSLTSYNIDYPKLQRSLIIYFNSRFPFEIEKWEETNAPWGTDSLGLQTTANRIKRIKSAYWTQNREADTYLRDSLGLK